ncbi:MAG: hypothetical protein NC037_02105 [Bacteroides sp.]|nr:hypothetical protein [Bacillota bacterium]MCM1455308.1 hypothetical protein [Bacteroides sp.]
MIARKEIIILNGGGHKGIVKISAVTGKSGVAKVNCSLDFRPNNAKLYLIGDNVAQMTLKDTNCEDEVPFSAKSEIGCVLRSSSITMFGGGGSKSEMLKRIENASTRERTVEHEKTTPPSAAQDDKDDKNDVTATSSPEADAEKPAHVGATVKANASSLGEWTKYDGNNFYYAVKPQIDEMFVCYPEETLLADVVPNSKWVRVDADDGYYVVGLLYDEDEPSFICYGVPQLKSDGYVKAPAEIENLCVWLPLGASENISGYWIIYQSARTGEIIK